MKYLTETAFISVLEKCWSENEEKTDTELRHSCAKRDFVLFWVIKTPTPVLKSK
jgi:hypothetical protein